MFCHQLIHLFVDIDIENALVCMLYDFIPFYIVRLNKDKRELILFY